MIENTETPGIRNSTASPALRARYELALRRIEHEHQLENNRLNWYLAFQGFLFAGVALAKDGGPQMVSTFAWMIIPAVGALVSCFTLAGICASQMARTAIKDWYQSRAEQDEDCPALSPSAIGSQIGRSSARLLPIVLLFAWIWLPFTSHEMRPETIQITKTASSTNTVKMPIGKP
jgi:hypothetical protein